MQYVAQRDVPAGDLNGVTEHHIPAIILSGVAAEIRTGRPTPSIRQKFLTEATCAVLDAYVHKLTESCLVQLIKIEKLEMVVACSTYRRRRETQTRLWGI